MEGGYSSRIGRLQKIRWLPSLGGSPHHPRRSKSENCKHEDRGYSSLGDPDSYWMMLFQGSGQT